MFFSLCASYAYVIFVLTKKRESFNICTRQTQKREQLMYMCVRARMSVHKEKINVYVNKERESECACEKHNAFLQRCMHVYI